jgi:hypothetical protein
LVGHGRGINTGLPTNRTKSENTSYTSDVDVMSLFTMLMSRSGIHEVGILVGILRKLQHWNFSSIIFEYRSFAGPNARFNEEQFIEVFDETDLVLPSPLPTWWIEQQELWRAQHSK